MRIQEGNFLEICLNLVLTLPDDGRGPEFLKSFGFNDLQDELENEEEEELSLGGEVATAQVDSNGGFTATFTISRITTVEADNKRHKGK